MIRMENFRYRVITNTLVFLYLIAFSLFQNVSHAQNLSDQGINPAVLKIVTAFILEGEGEPDQVDETSVELSFSETDSNIYTIAEEFEISFAQVNQNIEFCFVLNDVDVNLSLVINESPQPLIEGENCFSIPQASPISITFIDTQSMG